MIIALTIFGSTGVKDFLPISFFKVKLPCTPSREILAPPQFHLGYLAQNEWGFVLASALGHDYNTASWPTYLKYLAPRQITDQQKDITHVQKYAPFTSTNNVMEVVLKHLQLQFVPDFLNLSHIILYFLSKFACKYISKKCYSTNRCLFRARMIKILILTVK